MKIWAQISSKEISTIYPNPSLHPRGKVFDNCLWVLLTRALLATVFPKFWQFEIVARSSHVRIWSNFWLKYIFTRRSRDMRPLGRLSINRATLVWICICESRRRIFTFTHRVSSQSRDFGPRTETMFSIGLVILVVVFMLFDGMPNETKICLTLSLRSSIMQLSLSKSWLQSSEVVASTRDFL